MEKLWKRKKKSVLENFAHRRKCLFYQFFVRGLNEFRSRTCAERECPKVFAYHEALRRQAFQLDSSFTLRYDGTAYYVAAFFCELPFREHEDWIFKHVNYVATVWIKAFLIHLGFPYVAGSEEFDWIRILATLTYECQAGLRPAGNAQVVHSVLAYSVSLRHLTVVVLVLYDKSACVLAIPLWNNLR